MTNWLRVKVEQDPFSGLIFKPIETPRPDGAFPQSARRKNSASGTLSHAFPQVQDVPEGCRDGSGGRRPPVRRRCFQTQRDGPVGAGYVLGP